MKKLEEVEFHVTGTKYFKYGDDYREVKNWFKKQKKTFPSNIQLMYIIKVYSFTQNFNTFTMKIDDKIMHADRKKA